MYFTMIKTSLQTMDTILESNPQIVLTQASPVDAVPFSTPIRPTDGTMRVVTFPGDSIHTATLVDHRPRIVKSSSLKIPVTRKASHRVREWVKRSSSARTSSTTGTRALGSDSLKSQIRHLGGGRIEAGEVAGGTLLAPNNVTAAGVKSTQQRSRATSIDSRVTQWLDFYPNPSERSKAQRQLNQPSRLEPSPLPSERPPQNLRPRPSSNADLRPAPLKIAQPESKSSLSGDPRSKPLARKNSKWKALPSLPDSEQPTTDPVRKQDPVVAAASATRDGVTPAAREVQSSQQDTSEARHSPPEIPDGRSGIPPQRPKGIQCVTPPPTPDSIAYGIASLRVGKAPNGYDSEIGNTKSGAPAESEASPDTKSLGHLDDDGARPERRIKPEAPGLMSTIHHTREERAWLHVNYRGEAPFLLAWGLDIARPGDREEGLLILRDLMQAEKEKEGKTSLGNI